MRPRNLEEGRRPGWWPQVRRRTTFDQPAPKSAPPAITPRPRKKRRKR